MLNEFELFKSLYHSKFQYYFDYVSVASKTQGRYQDRIKAEILSI